MGRDRTAFAFMEADSLVCVGNGCDENLARRVRNRSVTAHFWPPSIAPSGSDQITGHAVVALKWLLLVWTFAAFGEEISYRGYLVTRAADVGARSNAAYWIAVLLVSVLFGYGHYYKGPSGILDSGMAALVLGTAYLLSGRNLWVCILGHGFIDTFGVVAAFFGMNN